MLTALDLKRSLFDSAEQSFLNGIQEHGWYLTHVFADDDGPCFSYTTGFWRMLNFPELILFSLPMEACHQIFADLREKVLQGQKLLMDAPVSEIVDEYDVIMRPVLPANFEGYLGWNRWFYGGDSFQAAQVFFPDRYGAFPWSENVSEGFALTQPDLT